MELEDKPSIQSAVAKLLEAPGQDTTVNFIASDASSSKLGNFSIPKDVIQTFLQAGGSQKKLYKGHYHNIHKEGRSKFIISKGIRIPLKDLK